MKRLLILLLVCAGFANALPAAPTTTIAPAPIAHPALDGGRFLFVVSTSSSMRRIEAASRQAVFDMIFTGLNGYMRDGDTFGIWTFDNQTHAGEFPMQVWDAQNPMEAATHAAAHLREQKYAGASDTSVLIPKLQSVVGAVRDVTILIVMDGTTRFEETLYDEVVNSSVQRLAREQAHLKKPFIATLVAQGGKIKGAFVTIAGQPFTLPERPAPALVKKAAPAAATPNVPGVAASPRVASAPEKSSVSMTSSTVAVAPTPIPPRAKIIEVVTKTNVPVSLVESNVSAPALGAAPIPPVPSPASAVPPAPVAAPPEKTADSNSAPSVANVQPPSVTPAPTAPSSPPPEPTAAVPKPVSPVLAALMPKPQMAVSARELMPQPIEAQVPVEPVEESVQPMQAVAAVPQPGLSPMVMLIIGGLLLASALFLIAIVLRSLKPAPQPSFITRSMDRR